MKKVLREIEEKRKMGYSANELEVDYGYPDDGAKEEGYYLCKLTDCGATPISGILAKKREINATKLISKLDKMDIAHCF